MSELHETELIKNCLIPMSDGVTLAADMYRPKVNRRVPALVSSTPYHKDGDYGARYEELMRGMAQAGYTCLAVDVRGTGNSGGAAVVSMDERERRDYYETVEWIAKQDWCTGRVGVWGKSYVGASALLTAAECPPSLGAVMVFHGAPSPDGFLSTDGRLKFLETVANFGVQMTGWNFMPPEYRDSAGRWRSVWREHLESSVPWMVSAFDQAMWAADGLEPIRHTFERIKAPVYVFSGWRDVFPKEMIEVYRSLKVPKKLTAGPWMHVLPDVGHAGRIDYLHEMQRWFGHWLQDEDTGIMDEPPVAFWVQGTDSWFHADDFPPPEAEMQDLYLGPEGTLGYEPPASSGVGSESFEYNATAGAFSEARGPQGLGMDQRFDELKGLTYTTPPLERDLEICGAPEAVIKYETTASQTLLVVKLCDVDSNGRSTLITSGWLDVDWARDHHSTWGEVSDDESSAHLNLIPTAYLVSAGHRLRVFISGSNFPRVEPSYGEGRITVLRGGDPPSRVRLPVRPELPGTKKPKFRTAREIPHRPSAAPMWRVEHNPIAMTMTVRMGSTQSMLVNGGAGPATATYSHQCSATASEIDPLQWGTHSDNRCSWDDGHEKVEVHTVATYRPEGLDVSVAISINGATFWQKAWSRDWPKQWKS
jgi:putative CocE/NonD family hydrolase